jgi:hypothetical protein
MLERNADARTSGWPVSVSEFLLETCDEKEISACGDGFEKVARYRKISNTCPLH